MAGTDDPRDALTPMTKAGRAFVGTFIEHAGPDYRAAASHDIAVIEAEARALSPAQAAEQDRLAAIGAAVERLPESEDFTRGWIIESMDTAVPRVRLTIIDRENDTILVQVAARSLPEAVAKALDEPVTGEPER